MHFLRRAIEGHVSDEKEVVNILTALIDSSDPRQSADPYRPWMAAVLLFHLLYEDPEAKSLTMSISEGDAGNGEEVITCIQAIVGNLIDGLLKDSDERISAGYLMLLCGWLFEDPDAVNDFLGEGCSVQSLAQIVAQSSMDKILVPGLCAMLLGIIYEFSTKDSTISRATLQPILVSRLGRDRYVDKLTRLREHHLVRDFEVLPQNSVSEQGGALPDVYFDRAFIDFLKDNFSRLLRAIDRDPGMEVPVIANGIQKGISRELVDSLRAQLDDKGQALQRAEMDILTLEGKYGQEQAEHKKTKESGLVELGRIKSINDGLQRHHEDDLQRLRQQNRVSMDNMQRQNESDMGKMQIELEAIKRAADESAAQVRNRHEAEVKDLKETLRKSEIDLDKANRDHMQDLQTAHEEYSAELGTLQSRLDRAEEKAAEAEARAKRAAADLEDANSKTIKAEENRMESERARKAVQTELDDLLMLLADLEEKRAKDKVGHCTFKSAFAIILTRSQKRLKALNEPTSDVKDEEDAESDEEEKGE